MIFGQLKAYAWQAAALALLAAALTQTVRLANAKNAHAQTVAAFNAATAQAERQARQQAERYRQLERQHHAQITQIGAEAQTALDAATASAAAATAAGQRLQHELASYITTHRRAALARAAAGSSAPEPAALDLLADLQRRADATAGALAAIADQARARGHACERAYDGARAMTESANNHVETQKPAHPD